MKKTYNKPSVVVGESQTITIRCKKTNCSGSSNHITTTVPTSMKELENKNITKTA